MLATVETFARDAAHDGTHRLHRRRAHGPRHGEEHRREGLSADRAGAPQARGGRRPRRPAAPKEAASPRAVAEASDIVVLCVTGSPQVEASSWARTGSPRRESR